MSSFIEESLLTETDVGLIKGERDSDSNQSFSDANLEDGHLDSTDDSMRPELGETLLLYQSGVVDWKALDTSVLVQDNGNDTIIYSSDTSQPGEDADSGPRLKEDALLLAEADPAKEDEPDEPDGRDPRDLDLSNVNTVLIQSADGTSVCVNGKAVQLVDGTTAFVQHSKRDTELYTPIKLCNGNVIYVVAGTLLNSISTESLKVTYLTDTVEQDVKGEAVDVTDSTGQKQKSKGFQCYYKNCNKSYTSFHHLKVHLRVHTGDRPFRCTFEGCTKAFSTGFGLKTHVRTHNGERPYMCSHESCSKSFKTSGDLQKHVRIHTGERPFVCPIPECGRTFTTCNICKVHVRTHTGERPYKCTYPNCGKTFASVTNQRNHIRIHSGEKPYVCPVEKCGRRFTEYSSLYKHNIVHRQQPHTCHTCGKTYRQATGLLLHSKVAHGYDPALEGEEEEEEETLLMLSPDGGDSSMTEIFLVDNIKLDGGRLEEDTLFDDLKVDAVMDV